MEKPTILLIEPNKAISTQIGSLLTQLSYPYIIINRPNNLELFSLQSISAILVSIDINPDLIQQIHSINKTPFIFYSSTFNASISQQISKLPSPVYLARALSKDDLYVNIELSLHYHSHSQKKAP